VSPPTNVHQYYAPDYELDVRPSNMDNANSEEYLQKIKSQVIENLKRTTFAPSVQMTDVPRDPEGMDDEADAILDDLDEDDNPDERNTKRRWDKYVEKDGELSESEDEDENERNGVRRQPNARKRRNMMDYQNRNAVPDDEEMVNDQDSPRRERSRNGERTDGPQAVNGEVHGNGNSNVSPHSSIANPDESACSSGASPEGSIAPEDANMEDEDIDMADDADASGAAPAINHASTDGPQEATPPDSPPAIAAAPVAPAQIANAVGDDAMDEGDTLEEPEIAREEGGEERELENVTAEQATELAERSEEL